MLDRVKFSPLVKLQIEAKKFTQGYALIKIDYCIIEVYLFSGNILDLGTELPPADFTIKIFLNSKNKKNFTYSSN